MGTHTSSWSPFRTCADASTIRFRETFAGAVLDSSARTINPIPSQIHLAATYGWTLGRSL